MRNLRFREMLLLSRREKAARSVGLDQDATIVLGKNDTGKSALLKSMYATFGATAAIEHPRWLNADVISAIKFTVDNTPYTILRRGSFYAVFDGTDHLLLATSKVLSGLGPFLAELLNYKIVLTTMRGNEVVPPPPQHFFLPFYVDQDVGWAANWSSFANLSQVRDWRRSMAEYHSGIRPNEYYDAKVALITAQQNLRQARSEANVLERMLADVRPDITPAFNVDLEAFQATIAQLLQECTRLKEIEEQLSIHLSELSSRRHTLVAQLSVAGASLQEVARDYQFATEDVPHSEVACPMCGAIYANSFVERFSIAQDEDRLTELILHLREELAGVDAEIGHVSAEHSNRREEIQRINALLDQRQGEITVRTLVQSEGKKEINTLLNDRVNTARTRVAEEDARVTQSRARLKEFDQPERRQQILERYHNLMRSYLQELNVVTLKEEYYEQISSKISETGSDLPRALLAYYFSILNIMEEYSTSCRCPVVVDSPNQQGQDQDSLTRVLRFIRDRRPPQAQLILAVEEPLGVAFEAGTRWN